VFVVVPSVKLIVLLIFNVLIKFDIPVTVKEPSNEFTEFKLGVVIDDGVIIVEFKFEYVSIENAVIVVEFVVVPSVKVNELHTTEPEEDPEILFEFITF
jgi:hypothetical protein